MHGPDGTNNKNKVVYIEVVKFERIVYDHVSGPKFHVTVTLEELGDQTKLTMQMLFETAEEHNWTIEKYGAIEGLQQTLNHLEEYLARK